MKYKIVKKAEPGVSGGGTPKYYAFPHYSGNMNLFELSQRLSAMSTVTRGDAEAVLSNLVDIIAEQLMEGKIVKLGHIGSFRISLSSEGKSSADEVTSSSIKKSKVLFRPNVVLQNNLARLSFQKVKDVSANPLDDEAAAA